MLIRLQVFYWYLGKKKGRETQVTSAIRNKKIFMGRVQKEEKQLNDRDSSMELNVEEKNKQGKRD